MFRWQLVAASVVFFTLSFPSFPSSHSQSSSSTLVWAHETTDGPHGGGRSPHSNVPDPVREFAPAPESFLKSLRNGDKELRITAFGQEYILDVRQKSPFVAELPLMRGIFAAGTVRGFPGSHVRLTAVDEHVHGLVDFEEAEAASGDFQLHRTFEIHPPNIHSGARGGGRVERRRRQKREDAYLMGETVVEMSRMSNPTQDMFEAKYGAHTKRPRREKKQEEQKMQNNGATATAAKDSNHNHNHNHNAGNANGATTSPYTFDASFASAMAKLEWSNETTHDGIPLRKSRAVEMTATGTPLCGYKTANNPAKTTVIHPLPNRSPPGPPPSNPSYRVGGGKVCTVFLDVDSSVATALGSSAAASTFSLHTFAITQDAYARSTTLGLELSLKGHVVHTAGTTWDGAQSGKPTPNDIGDALTNYMSYLSGIPFTNNRQDICTNHALIWKAGKPRCGTANPPAQCTCGTFSGAWAETVGIANGADTSFEAVSTGSETIKVGTVCGSTENGLWPDATVYGHASWQAYFAADGANTHYGIGAGITAVGHWDISAGANCAVASTAYATANSQYVARSTMQVAETMMHELGHQFGAQHDCGSTDPSGPTCGGISAKKSQHMTDCANSNLDHAVMSYSNGIMNTLKFSDCSVADIEAHFNAWDTTYQQPMSCLLSLAASDSSLYDWHLRNRETYDSASAPAGVSGAVKVGFDYESFFYFYYETTATNSNTGVTGGAPVYRDGTKQHNLYLWYDAANMRWTIGYTVGSTGIYTGADVSGYSNVCVNNRVWTPDGSFTGQSTLSVVCLSGVLGGQTMTSYCNSVTSSDCGSGQMVDTSAATTACSTFPCAASSGGADHANCCNTAAPSCGDKNGVGGSAAVAVSDADCGTGYSYAPSSAMTACPQSPCYVSVPGYYQHPQCCTAHQTCAAANFQQSSCASGLTVQNPLSTTPCAAATCTSTDCCGAVCSTVTDAACGNGYAYDTTAASQVCSASPCAVSSSSDTDHALCCNGALVTCDDKTGAGGGSPVAVTDGECGSGYSYNAANANSGCGTNPCQTSVVGANDHPACCGAHSTCASQGYASCSTANTRPTSPLPGALCAAPTCTDPDCCTATCSSVTDAACGPNFISDASAANTMCALQTCNVATQNSGDHSTCCTAAVATCRDKNGVGGGSGVAITNADCGNGYSYNANNAASTCANSGACNVATPGSGDHLTCCVGHNTCDSGGAGGAYAGCMTTGLQIKSPVPTTRCAASTCTNAECCDQTCGSVSDANCGAGYLADTSAVNTKCAVAACNVATANSGDHATCCNAAAAICSDKNGVGGGNGVTVTDAECQAGYSYNPTNAASTCQSNPCGTGIVGSYDHPTCCVIHDTCTNPPYQNSVCGDYKQVKSPLPTTACSAATCSAAECCDSNPSCSSSGFTSTSCAANWAIKSPAPNTPCQSYTGCTSPECCYDPTAPKAQTKNGKTKTPKDPTQTKAPKDPTKTKAPKDPTKTKAPKDPTKTKAPKDPTKTKAPKDPTKTKAPKDPTKTKAPKDPTKTKAPKDPTKTKAPKDPTKVKKAKKLTRSESRRLKYADKTNVTSRTPFLAAVSFSSMLVVLFIGFVVSRRTSKRPGGKYHRVDHRGALYAGSNISSGGGGGGGGVGNENAVNNLLAPFGNNSTPYYGSRSVQGPAGVHSVAAVNIRSPSQAEGSAILSPRRIWGSSNSRGNSSSSSNNNDENNNTRITYDSGDGHASPLFGGSAGGYYGTGVGTGNEAHNVPGAEINGGAAADYTDGGIPLSPFSPFETGIMEVVLVEAGGGGGATAVASNADDNNNASARAPSNSILRRLLGYKAKKARAKARKKEQRRQAAESPRAKLTTAADNPGNAAGGAADYMDGDIPLSTFETSIMEDVLAEAAAKSQEEQNHGVPRRQDSRPRTMPHTPF